jgi:hypothetical protein
MKSGRAKPTRKVPEDKAQDRDWQGTPLTGPNPPKTPPSHGRDGLGGGTGVHRTKEAK